MSSVKAVVGSDIGWRPSPRAPRVYLKDLGSAGGFLLQLVRYDSGGSLLIEPAGGPLLLYVLDGELIYSGRRLWRGAAESIPGSAAAAEARSDIGCTLLCVQSESPPSAQPSSA